MNMHPPFPESRLSDPKRQAELRVYQELAASAAPGLALYQAHTGPHAPEVDFALWLERIAHYGIEVKGGRYTIENGVWYLHSLQGREPVACPLTQAWDAAISIRQMLKETLGRKIFVFAVLVFTDMDPDPAIQEQADHSKTRVLWGVQDLVNNLTAVAQGREIFSPPTAAQIVEEAKLIAPSLELPANPSKSQPQMDVQAQHLNIQNAGVVNVYITGEGDEPPKQDPPSHE